MKTRSWWLVLLAGLIGFHLGQGEARTVAAQTATARCTATVPQDWGQFKGASEYGLAFEDQSGTIRLVRQIACSGLETTPQVAVELRRH